MSKLLQRFWQLFSHRGVRSRFTVHPTNEDSQTTMSEAALEKLKEYGYGFNEKGELRKLDKETNEPGDQPYEFDAFNGNQDKNQEHYEQIADLIPEIIYELLEKHGMCRLYIPPDAPKNASTFIFTLPKELNNPKKLLVLIHGSGFVRAGQWARSLIINNSLEHGTQIPYIKQAQELGYNIIVTNTNDNYRMIDGVRKPIPKLSSPKEHAFYVWKNIVMPCNPQVVAIVAHSYGGVVAMALAEEFPKFFEEKVACIALTDSAHFHIPKKATSVIKNIACNWVASSQPLDTEIKRENGDLKLVSAGHEKHEWTSWAAQSSVFKFMEEKCKQFLAAKETE